MDDLVFPDLRKASLADRPFNEALYRSTRDDLTCLGEGPAIDALIKMQQSIQEQGHRTHYPNAEHLLLSRQGRDIARLIIDRNPQRLHIVDITVLASERSQGAGTALLHWAQQQAQQANVPLELHVQRHNLRAQRLYLTQGFARIGGDEVSDHMRWQA